MTRVAIALAVLMTTLTSASARTLRVPEDYERVTTAVIQAVDGDTVLIAPGIYRERFSIVAKDIVVRGSMGADATIIDGSETAGNVVSIHHGSPNTILEDLTLTGGSLNAAAPESVGTAVYVNEGDPIIQRCRMTGNQASAAGGVLVYFFARPTIRDNWIAYNTGGGILVETDNGLETGPMAHIENNMIVRNLGYGIKVIKGAKARVFNNTIAFNTGDGLRAQHTAVSLRKVRIQASRNIITDNWGAGIIRRDASVCFSLSCNNVFGNGNGSWLGINERDPCFPGRGDGSVSLPAEFENGGADDFRLKPDAQLYGLCQGDCGAIGADNDCSKWVSVEQSTWGDVKVRYRE